MISKAFGIMCLIIGLAFLLIGLDEVFSEKVYYGHNPVGPTYVGDQALKIGLRDSGTGILFAGLGVLLIWNPRKDEEDL